MKRILNAISSLENDIRYSVIKIEKNRKILSDLEHGNFDSYDKDYVL